MQNGTQFSDDEMTGRANCKTFHSSIPFSAPPLAESIEDGTLYLTYHCFIKNMLPKFDLEEAELERVWARLVQGLPDGLDRPRGSPSPA